MVREIWHDRVQQALDSAAEKKTDRLRRRGMRPASTNKEKDEKDRTDAAALAGGTVLSDDPEIGQNRASFSAQILR